MCSNLERVYWNGSDSDYAEIGSYAFVNCSSLSEIVTYEDNVLKKTNDITDYNSQVLIGEGAFDGCDNFNSSDGFNSNNMLIYTPGEFLGKDINDVAQMFGADYFETSHLEYSSPGLPTFRIVGKPFEYSLDEYYYQISNVTFENNNMWLTNNGSSTDKIRLGMTRDEIYALVKQAYLESQNLPFEQRAVNEFSGGKSNDEQLRFNTPNEYYSIYFDGDGVSKYCVVGINWG